MSRKLNEKTMQGSVKPDPNIDEDLSIWRRGDGEDNKKTSPPDDELVQLHSITVAEIYAPPQIENLYAGLRSLGWDQDPLRNEDPVSWIQRSRESGFGGSWLNLGLILRPGEKRFLGSTRVGNLPNHVSYALGQVHCLTSSVTSVVITFVYDDEFGLSYDVALRKERRTFLEKLPRGNRIVSPYFQKEREIQEIRRNAERAVADWFRENLPGIFSGGILGGRFPACEFITLTRGEPFGADRHDYLAVLGLANEFNVWQSKKLPDLKFVEPTFGENRRLTAVLATSTKKLDALDLQPRGGNNRRAYVSYLDDDLSALMSRLALLAVIVGLEKKLNIERDAGLVNVRREEDTKSVLAEMNRLILASIDTATISSDLRLFSSRKGWFEHGLPALSPSKPEHFESGMTYASGLRQHIDSRAERLQETNRSVMELVSQQGAILTAKESIRLQRRVDIMTWVMVFLTVVTVIFSAVAAYDQLQRIRKEWESSQSK